MSDTPTVELQVCPPSTTIFWLKLLEPTALTKSSTPQLLLGLSDVQTASQVLLVHRVVPPRSKAEVVCDPRGGSPGH